VSVIELFLPPDIEIQENSYFHETIDIKNTVRKDYHLQHMHWPGSIQGIEI